MIKMSNKVIGIISGSSAALIGGTTITANVLLKDEIGTKPNTNPLGRDKSYHYYSIVNKIASNPQLDNLITMIKDDNNVTYILEEEKFLSNIKPIVQEALKTIPTFAADYLNYQIDIHYKINTKSIFVDLVWFKPEAKNKFFDQFELILQTS
ncbi:MAG: hypothetical protein KBS35_02960 [Mycoplasma sp.]|nr:hypothetical protein [Candidatus Hennigella equi]